MSKSKAIKETLLIAAGIVCCLTVMKFAPGGCRPIDKERVERDTIRTVVIDTVTVICPVEQTILPIGAIQYRLPVAKCDNVKNSYADTAMQDSAECIHGDTINMLYGNGAGGKPRQCFDSATVEIPITQKYYRDSMYEAWVSGFAQHLDSLRIYPRSEIIEIKEHKPPNRWHIGVSAGYALTPRGVTPYIGIGITYSIFSWK